MEISEVRIKLVEESSERLRAFCSITLDGDFVIRDLKIIDGVSGPFVAMPSRKLADRCSRCGCKNHLRARYCNDCGAKLNENRAPKDNLGRAKLHADVAHPINAACRERIQAAVVSAYEAELERSKSPDYKPPVYDDFGDDDITHLVEEPQGFSAGLPPATEESPDEEEPVVIAEGSDEEGAFSDYNSLIADLRREAATRHGRSERGDASYAQSRPAAQRFESGGRGERGAREGNRPERGADRPGRAERRDDRGPRRNQRRDDRRGGSPRDDRRRDDARSPGFAHEPAPMKSPPPVAPPAPPEEEDDFAAGL